jgi:hypothetical protein
MHLKYGKILSSCCIHWSCRDRQDLAFRYITVLYRSMPIPATAAPTAKRATQIPEGISHLRVVKLLCLRRSLNTRRRDPNKLQVQPRLQHIHQQLLEEFHMPPPLLLPLMDTNNPVIPPYSRASIMPSRIQVSPLCNCRKV